MTLSHHILTHYQLYFDGGDRGNNSLYLCLSPQSPPTLAAEIINRLRSLGLWSPAEAKIIAERDKGAYAEQMNFLACAQFGDKSENFLLARFDHPAFTSSSSRWSQWLAAFTEGEKSASLSTSR